MNRIRSEERRTRSNRERAARARDAQRQRTAHALSLADEIAEHAPTTTAIGSAAEQRAVAALEAAGYLIIVRNWSRAIGELDVVAWDGDVLVFVEVRSREDDVHGHAAEMVSSRKRAKVSRVASLYLEIERPAYDACRFDVVAVTGPDVEVIKDAWRV